MNDNKLKKYLIIAFAAGWLMQIAASLLLPSMGTTVFQAIVALSMFTPTLAAVLSGHSLQTLGWKPEFKGKARYYLCAWFLPGLLTVLGYLLFLAVFPKSFDLSGSYMIATVGQEAYDAMLAQGFSYPGYILSAVIQTLLYIPLINMFPALGEEIGWRGVMTPALIRKYGETKGVLIAGVIWGIWHWPLIILAGYEYGTGYPGAPFTGILLFCVIATALGILLSWLYEKTGNILVPSLFHGSFNAWATLPMAVTSTAYLNHRLLGPAPVGILAAMPFLAAAWFILHRKAKQ